MDITEAVAIYSSVWMQWFRYWVDASAPVCVNGKFHYFKGQLKPLTWEEYKKQINHGRLRN